MIFYKNGENCQKGGDTVKRGRPYFFYSFEYSGLEAFFLNKILDIMLRIGAEKAILRPVSVVWVPLFHQCKSDNLPEF